MANGGSGDGGSLVQPDRVLHLFFAPELAIKPPVAQNGNITAKVYTQHINFSST